MSGLLALLAGCALLAATAVRIASVLAPRAAASFVLAAFTLAYAEVVLLLWILSAFRGVTTPGVLAALAAGFVAAWGGTRRLPARLPRRPAPFRDPLVVALAVVAGAGFAYILVLTLTTPQTDVDTLYDHLWRAALWWQQHKAGYPDCSCAPYINAYPPNGELGLLFTMVLGRSDRYVGLVQGLAFAMVAVAVARLAQQLGLPRRDSIVAGLLAATLPILALEASTGQNDVVTASFLLAATVFLLDDAPWLAAAATALAVGTKIDVPLALPLLVAVALVARPAGRRRSRIAAIVLGAAAGAYWYVVNSVETGSWNGGYPNIHIDRSIAAIASRTARFGIQFIDVSGATAWNRWLFPAAGVLVALALLGRTRSWRSASVAFAVAASPVLLFPIAHGLVRAYSKFWYVVGRRDLVFDPGRDIAHSASNWSWFGPLGSLLLVGVGVAVLVLVRRGRLPRLAALFALAPWYWLVGFSIALFYQPFAGRFFMYPFALAATTWGIVARVRPVAWGIAAVSALALALALVNDYKRPAGAPVAPHYRSIWSTPRWLSQGRETHDPDVLRYADAHLPDHGTVALRLVPHYNGYVFLGGGLDRRVELIHADTRDAPGADWAFIYPRGTTSLCAADWKVVADVTPGWTVLRRVARQRCA